MKTIDLNCDMGELPEALADGSQEELMGYISSANIACGGHAGNAEMMRMTVEQALRHKVTVGAHPGYEDRGNFGRKDLEIAAAEISESVRKQIVALDEIATSLGAHIGHMKAHGALYNRAAGDPAVARAIAEGVRRWRSDVVLVGLAGSVMLETFHDAGFAVAAEAFADRRYEKDGSLRARKFSDALITDPEEAAAQAVQIVTEGSVTTGDGTLVPLQAQTLCIHGDTPGAVGIAARVRERLDQAGIRVATLKAATRL